MELRINASLLRRGHKGLKLLPILELHLADPCPHFRRVVLARLLADEHRLLYVCICELVHKLYIKKNKTGTNLV